MSRRDPTSRPVEAISQLAVLCGKELRQFFRDPALVIFLFYAFFGAVYLAATGVSTHLANAAIVFVDEDRTPESRALIERFRPPHFRPLGEAESASAGAAMLDREEATVAIVVPPRFGADLAAGRAASVQALVDTSNATLGTLASAAVGEIVARHAAESVRAASAAHRPGGGVVDAQRVRYNPNREERRHLAISELVEMATLFSMLLPGAALARERERGTIEQLLVSPISPGRILLSKILPMTALVTVASTVSLLVVVQGVLGIRVQGEVWHFSLVIAALSAAMAGVGILLATIGRSVAQVGLLAMLVLGPIMLLSGAVTPAESMPWLVRPVMYASPLHYGLDAAIGVVLRGADLRTLLPLIGMILLLAVATSGLALLRFRRGFR